MMDRKKLLQSLPEIERYGAAVLAVVCTLAIHLALDPFLGDRAPFLFFVLAIVIVKRLWGRGPGLLATLLGGIAAWYFAIEPKFSFGIANNADALNLTAYFAVGASISFLGEVSGRLPASQSEPGRNIKYRVVRQTAVLAAAAVVLVGMVLLLLRDFRRTQDAQAWVVHTYRVINSAESLLSTMKDAERGERGFLLTGDESYLAPYQSAIAALPKGLEDLKDLTSDNPRQQARWVEINQLAEERLSVLRHAIDLRKASEPDAALALVRYGRGEPAMDRLRSTLDMVVDEENRLLTARTAEAEVRASRSRWVLGLGSGALVLLLVFASVVIDRETLRREEITQALRRHADLLEQAHDSLFTWRLGGVINYWSRGAETLFGYGREEAVGRSRHKLLQTHHPLGMAQIDALVEREGQWKGELTQTTKDGRKLIVDAVWTLAVDADGSKTVLEANHDITERKRAEESLRESEARLRTLGDNLPAGAIYRFCQDANGKQYIDFISAGIERLTGVPAAEVTHDVMAAFGTIPPEDFERMKAAIALSHEQLTRFEVEVRHIHRKTGEVRWSLLRSSPTRYPDGTTIWDGIEFDISGIKQVEKSLRESESRERARAAEFEALMEAAPVGIFKSEDAACRWMSGNRMAYDLLRRPRASNLSKSGPDNEKPVNFRAMKDGKEIPLSELPMQKAAATGEAVRDSEMDFVFADGVTTNVLGSAVPLRDESGRPRGAIGAFVDMTARKQAEAQNLLLATAIEQAAETVVITDRDATIQYVNPAFSRTTGYTREEAIGRNPRVLKSGQHDAKFYQEMWATLTAGKLWHGEFTNRRKDGALYMEEATIAPVRDASGEITNYIAIKFDITERKRAEIALRESERMLRLFVRHAPAAIAMLDREMRYLAVSQRWLADYRLGDRDLRGLSHYVVFPEMPERWKEIHQRCLAGSVERCKDDAFPRPDGTTDWLSWEVRPWRKIDESIGGIIIFSELITERKQAEDALQESELRYRQLFERAESALGVYEMVFDAEGNPSDFRFLNVNPAFERMTGLRASEILGHTALEITPGLEEYWIKLFGQVATTGKPTVFEQYTQPLARYYAGTAYSPRPHQVAVTFMDVSERKRAEEEVRLLNVELEQRVRARTTALEAANRELEAFAHSVSHDLRAPLRGIDGWSQALLEDYGARLDAQGHKYLDRVRSEAQRMGTLIDDLLHLSRVGRVELVPSAVDLTSLAETIVTRLKEAHSGRIIEFIVAPQLKCTGDARLLEIALTNLLDNAVKFTGPRTLARVEFGQTNMQGSPAFFVRDNGVGFDMAYARMLFAPFQRLHKTSEFPGTGIGLATVQRVIHRHGGRIWAEARVGEGATLYFTIGESKA